MHIFAKKESEKDDMKSPVNKRNQHSQRFIVAISDVTCSNY